MSEGWLTILPPDNPMSIRLDQLTSVGGEKRGTVMSSDAKFYIVVGNVSGLLLSIVVAIIACTRLSGSPEWERGDGMDYFEWISTIYDFS